MFRTVRTAFAPVGLGLMLLASSGCADAQEVSAHPNSIQPETTLSVSATGTVTSVPDIAFINAGVQTEGRTADVALAENAARMNGVFSALKAAGVEDRHIQTSNFSISPRYNYNRDNDRPPELVGYTASNSVRAKIVNLDTLGETIDALVGAGGNTLNGVSFDLEDKTDVRNQARRDAINAATARAELYASEAGYRVARIVTITEGSGNVGYVPQANTFAVSERAAPAPSPVSGGELEFSATVSVVFELKK